MVCYDMIFGFFKKKEKKKAYTFKEKRKENPLAYEKWRRNEDDFLRNYWNDKSNKKSRSAKVQELSEKLQRGRGAINSRIRKLKLE